MEVFPCDIVYRDIIFYVRKVSCIFSMLDKNATWDPRIAGNFQRICRTVFLFHGSALAL